MARENPQEPVRRHRRRRRGMPTALAVALIILGLAAGGTLGYVVGARSQQTALNEKGAQLASADKRILDLETVLELQGIDPNAEFFKDLNPVDDPAAAALTGANEPLPNNNALVAGEDALAAQPTDAGEPVVVAEFGDVRVMSDEVLEAYNAKVNQLLLMGQDVSDYANSLMEDTLSSIVTEKIEYQKAEELGLTTLTAEDEAAIDQQAQAAFKDTVEFYLMDDPEMTDEEAWTAAVERVAEEDGTTLESLRAQIEQEWWRDKLAAHVARDVTPTEEQIQETYDLSLADQQALYASSSGDYEFARRYGGETVVYNPEGYRTFKRILLAFGEEDGYRASEILAELESLDPAADAEQADLLNGELDTLYATLQRTADDVLDRLAQGESFEALLAEYGKDPDQDEPGVRSDGYYVSADSTSYAPAITSAAMALSKVGDVSEPVRTAEGISILLYSADVPAGPVALESVRDNLTAETLESLKYDAYEEQIAKWVEEANVTYHREVLE